MPGPEREGGPMAAAEEEYAKRAYPAVYVPFELTRNAHAAWSNARARALAIGTPAARTVDARRSELGKRAQRIDV